jgi:hypothetical protein
VEAALVPLQIPGAERVDRAEKALVSVGLGDRAEHLDALLATAFGPLTDDMTKMAARYSDAEFRTIADWIRRTTDVLIANTRRIMSLDQP